MFAGTYNFRDIGGYVGLSGRAVQSGRLYRSDALARLTEADRPTFESLGIRTVIDLRRPSELDVLGRCPAWNGLTWHNIAPDHPEWFPEEYSHAEGVARFLARRYAELADQGSAGIVKVIGLIAESENAPAVVHCLAGKDRTGVVIALVLGLLGVSDQDIATDYARTGEAAIHVVAELRNEPAEEIARRQPYSLHTPAEAMLLFLDGVRARHGSAETYLVDAGLGYDQIDSLRGHLLTSAR
jgi:protein-tyrosine phosphatase